MRFLSQSTELLKTNIDALEEGVALLSLLTPQQYTQGYKPAFHSTIGAHFRHVLEHYRCFLQQLESCQLCYDSRERDQLLECDYEYANQTLSELVSLITNLDSRDLDQKCVVLDQHSGSGVTSTLYRELLFLQSHTMHHYAIIGAMTRALGEQPADDFGVAIATREHQKSCNEPVVGDLSKCAQ
jgi:uncharacterized damage-inducible protein DinB